MSAGARLVCATGEGDGASPGDAFMRIVIDGAARSMRGLDALLAPECFNVQVGDPA